MINFIYSIFKVKQTTQNPWGASTLEWTTPIHAGHGNWDGNLPVVHRWPYDYGKDGERKIYRRLYLSNPVNQICINNHKGLNKF